MRYVLLGAAAILAAAAVPASAETQRWGGSGFTSARGDAGVRVHRGEDRGRDDRGRRDRRRDRDGDFRDGDFRDERGRDHRDRFDRGDTYFGEREYQGDTLWGPDGFNDWWHDRPERSYPAWVARNTNCERQYWSGGGWRC